MILLDVTPQSETISGGFIASIIVNIVLVAALITISVFFKRYVNRGNINYNLRIVCVDDTFDFY